MSRNNPSSFGLADIRLHAIAALAVLLALAPVAAQNPRPLSRAVTAAGATAVTAAGAEGAAKAADAAPTLFGSSFLLQGDEIDLKIVNNEVTDLDAVGAVNLETDELVILSHRLKYVSATKVLTAYRNLNDPASEVVVRQGNNISYCEEFVHNTETGSSDFLGKSRVEILQEDGNKMDLKSDSLTITQGDAPDSRVLRMRGNSSLGSGGRQSTQQRDASGQIIMPTGQVVTPAPTPAPTPVPTVRPTPAVTAAPPRATPAAGATRSVRPAPTPAPRR